MKKIVLTSFWFLIPILLLAQENRIKALQIKDVLYTTTDRAGDIYVATKRSIRKFNKEGQQLNSYSIAHPPTLFDTGNGVRLLSYYRSSQRYTILTPSLTETESHAIDPAFAIEPWLVCTSGDYDILILDASDWSIKKIDTRRSSVITEFKIDSGLWKSADFIYMREYQSFIFLLDKKSGINIFNRMGIPLKAIAVKGLSNFNFLGEELYYLHDKKIHFIDLLTAQTREENLSHPCEFIVLTDERMITTGLDNVEIFSYTP